MSDMVSWWHYMTAVQWNFNRYACRLGTIQSNMLSGPLEIEEKSYLTDVPPSDMPTNTLKLISKDCYIVNTIYMPWRELLCRCSCSICMPADLVSQTTLLFKRAYWLSADTSWMLARLWPLNRHACWPFVTQFCMPAGAVLLYLVYLLVWCLTISRVCWYGVSLSAVPAGVVLHYKSCFLVLVWYITICHDCWCGASLYVMPSGVMPHCSHVFWCGASL